MGYWRSAIVAISLATLSGAAEGQQQPQPPPLTAGEHRAAKEALERFISPRLSRFSGEAEFRAYVDAFRAAWRGASNGAARPGPIRFAQAQPPGDVQSDTTVPACPEGDPLCPTSDTSADDQMIMVTGARVPPRNPSITNNQLVGIEEGDIVKQIDDYLLVLQDGRLFVVDIAAGQGRRLVLVDRADVYRNPDADTWYDEMLVHEDRVLVLGYSYDEGMTELSVFRLSEDGRLSNEGIFHISSGDYYSTTNYATRLVGDSLVIYTPFEIERYRRDFVFPVIRRWVPDDQLYADAPRGTPIVDARNIYRPVRPADQPVVHAVSVCPLGPIGPTANLDCRTVGFVGPRAVQWYVTGDHVFLWTQDRESWGYGDEDCDPYLRFTPDAADPALLYRVAVADGSVALAAARGTPPDQFALDASGGRFHALLEWHPSECDSYDWPARLVYLDVPDSALSDTLAEVPQDAYTSLPPTGSRWTVSRFTEHYLVYGGLSGWRRGLPDFASLDERGYGNEYIKRTRDEPGLPAFVLPIDRPDQVQPLAIGHTVIRAEQAGSDVVLTGYRDRGGLIVTLIDLDRAPRIASSVRLDGRFESEGRSHAFNSLVEPDGSGLMGLPTVPRISQGSRAWWRSSASDISFLQIDRRGQLVPIGELERRFNYDDDEVDDDEDGIPGYRCEVSCIDWYGNSRPIFTDGRIFALSGTELIEGWVGEAEIHERERLNIALESVRLAEARAEGGQ